MFFRKLFGVKYAFILGVGLCAKFSTASSPKTSYSIPDISATLFSAILTAYIIMKPIIVSHILLGSIHRKSEITTLFSIQELKSSPEDERKNE